jgi:Helix-turn-helix domain
MPVPTQPSVIDPADILTPKELAARLRVKPTWLYERARRGEALPHFKMGRYHRYSWQAVCAWLQSVHVAGPAKSRAR